MKVAIIGSRSYNNYSGLLKHIPIGTSEIISGGAFGTDLLAEHFAKNNNIKTTIFLPDYPKYGKFAPIKRNQNIIEQADYVLAFWDGKSNGTKNVINTCLKLSKPIKVITF